MNPVSCTLLLQTIHRLVDDGVNEDEYLKIYHDSDGWNVETDRTVDIATDLGTAIEKALRSIDKEYPDPEALERAEYERLRLKYGGAPLPEPEPPGVWVGYEQGYDEVTLCAAFGTEAEARAWENGRQGFYVERVPYHES